MKNIIWRWTPLKSIGPFDFGTAIISYLGEYDLSLVESNDDPTEWDTYDVEGYDVRVHVDNGKITSVGCYEEFLFEGCNLLGKSLDEIISKIGQKPSGNPDEINFEEDSDVGQLVYEFDECALQVWIKNNIAVTIFCGPRYEDEEI